MPSSSFSSRTKANIFRAVSSYASVAMICEPMWQWIPAMATFGRAFAVSYAFLAMPPSRWTPNFDSEQPVLIWWSVSGSTPGLIRKEIRAVVPSRTAAAEICASSSRLSTFRMTSCRREKSISEGLLEDDEKRTSLPFAPARSAARISPSETTSGARPSERMSLTISTFVFAFRAYRILSFGKRGPKPARSARACSRIVSAS